MKKFLMAMIFFTIAYATTFTIMMLLFEMVMLRAEVIR